MNDKSISSLLTETRVFPPSSEFTSKARLKPEDLSALYKEAEDNHEGYWARLARDEIQWHKPFTEVLDASDAPNYRWFADGELNVSYNCLDVHLATQPDKTAIIFEGEGGDKRRLTYSELTRDVCRFANALKDQGVAKGDRVVIYMPMVPEAVIAMQACARIGAVHSVVFGGF
jgi:acetyl-CoA synthetase